MKKYLTPLYLYFSRERGASATQYGILVAGVAIALIFVFITYTDVINEGFLFIIDTIRNAAGGG